MQLRPDIAGPRLVPASSWGPLARHLSAVKINALYNEGVYGDATETIRNRVPAFGDLLGLNLAEQIEAAEALQWDLIYTARAAHTIERDLFDIAKELLTRLGDLAQTVREHPELNL